MDRSLTAVRPAVAQVVSGPTRTGAPALDPDAPGWHRPPPSADQLRGDALLAGALLVGAVLSMALLRTAGIYDDPAAGWVSVLCLAGATVPLAVRRRWPSAVTVVISVAFVVAGELMVPETLFLNIALFMALYTVGAWDPDRRRATVVRTVVVVGMFAWLVVSIFRSATDPEALPGLSRAGAFSPFVAYMLIQLLTNVLYFAGAAWFGNHAWASARERARTAYRGRLLQLERQVVERQAVTLERLRLARELHDAVAHHVSMMGIQAAAARALIGTDASRAAAALEQVEESARQSIAELQGVLGTLREAPREGVTPGGVGAPPEIGSRDHVGSLTVDRIPELVAQSTEVGLPATFQVVGDPVPLPPLVSLNLYRIAQEALTNSRKHGGVGAHADVRLRYLGDAVELEVADDGAGVRRGVAASSGLGLLGMRERVAADGGTLDAGPRGRGGFLVRAYIPLEARTTQEDQ
ncbi:sensor histidine kinase [Actinotalea ferrariae]|uniref:sensor histidine kinase n=1 Tax=Actinotalea ferrariae TaxID=1386098 RepID=UPI0027E015E9|nr:sensor histidine kinase [Actinotalea ferrariae]